MCYRFKKIMCVKNLLQIALQCEVIEWYSLNLIHFNIMKTNRKQFSVAVNIFDEQTAYQITKTILRLI